MNLFFVYLSIHVLLLVLAAILDIHVILNNSARWLTRIDIWDMYGFVNLKS